MKKYITKAEKEDSKKYRPALYFLGICFTICTLICVSFVKSFLFSTGEMPTALKIFGFCFFGICFLGVEGGIVFAFILLMKDSRGGEVVYIGTVTKKESSFNMNIKGRGGMHTTYYFELDNEKRFRNVNVQFYSMIEEGQKVEVHTTRFSGEILNIYTS